MSLPTETPVWTEDEIEKIKQASLKIAEKGWQDLEKMGISTPEQLSEFAAKHPGYFIDEEQLLKRL